MNNTLHGRSDAEVKQNLDIQYQAMKIQFRKGNDIIFGSNMYNKLVYYTYHCLKSNNHNIEDIKKIAELSDEYMHNLISISNDKEDVSDCITSIISRDRQIIEELTEELFYDSPKKLDDNQYSALRPILQNYILKKSTTETIQDKQSEIAYIFRELNRKGKISEKNYNEIYDFLSDDETYEMLQFKIAIAKAKEIKNPDLFKQQKEANELQDELFCINQEVTDVSDIKDICHYLIRLQNIKPIETVRQKRFAIKSVVAKWALNLANDKSKLGGKKTDKFIFELENLLGDSNNEAIKLTPNMRKIGLDFAEELNDISQAIKKHFGININDSSITFEELKNSNSDSNLFGFVNNIRENLKMEATTIKTNAEYVDGNDTILKMYSLLGKNNKIGVSADDIATIQHVITNTNITEKEKLDLKREKLIEILKEEHSHISDTKLYDMARENLLKKRKPDTNLDELDYHFTESRILPLYVNDKFLNTPATKFIDMRDELTARIYFNFTRKSSEFHKTFKTQNPAFYKHAMNYLFEKKKTVLKSMLMIKSEEMVIDIHEGENNKKHKRKSNRTKKQNTR